jgi:hypothetical protein
VLIEMTRIDNTTITAPISSSHSHTICRANIGNTPEQWLCHGPFFVRKPL